MTRCATTPLRCRFMRAARDAGANIRIAPLLSYGMLHEYCRRSAYEKVVL